MPKTYRPSSPFNHRGQSLIQLIVSMGVAAILMLAIVTAQINQARENHALSEKLASLDLERSVTQALSNATTCSQIFAAENILAGSTLQFDSTSVSLAQPAVLVIHQIPSAGGAIAVSGGFASPLSNTLSLLPETGSSVGLKVLVTSPTSAKLVATFDQEKLIRPLNSLSFPLLLKTSGSPNNLTILGCAGAETPPVCLPPNTLNYDGSAWSCSGGVINPVQPGRCPVGKTLVGLNPDGSMNCDDHGSMGRCKNGDEALFDLQSNGTFGQPATVVIRNDPSYAYYPGSHMLCIDGIWTLLYTVSQSGDWGNGGSGAGGGD